MTNELGFDTKFAAQIGESQVWEGKEILFDPDSSPASWEHYKICYKDTFKDTYNIQSPQFFERRKSDGMYEIKPRRCKNRLYALKNEKLNEKEMGAYEAVERLSGDTDFNFNEYKSKGEEKNKGISSLLSNLDYEGKEKLKKCREKQNTLVNFSLMQSMGNMQRVKSEGLKCEWFDRLDTLIYFLDCYYRGDPNNKDKIFSGSACRDNKIALEEYLKSFSGINDYCKKIYFIDEDLVKELINNGSKPINTVEDISKYMDLALEFWKQKEEKLRSLYSKALKK